jgi:hypothetical protein
MGLKKKLRGDLLSELFKVVKIPSNENVEIQLPNGKTKEVNNNNVKRREKTTK